MLSRHGTLFILASGLLIASAPGFAQSMKVEDLAQGKIIVTPRDSPDEHFSNSVIVLAHYDRTGALGLMLHYKSDLTVQKMFAGVQGTEKRTDSLYVGGPVEIPALLALVRSKTSLAGTSFVTGNLYLMTAKQGIGTALADGRAAKDIRVFVGYSGWGPGQLEREVLRHGWYIFDYDEDLVFDEHPETLWERLIGKTERRLAALPPAHLPSAKLSATFGVGPTPQQKRGPI